MEPVFLRLGEVVEIHRDQIRRYGGSPGIRDVGLLESAVAVPQSGAFGHYAHKNLFEMAAAYLFHIVNNHPFVDGNKRTGAATALVFLLLNGIKINADEDLFETMVRAVAEGKKGKAAITRFFSVNHKR